MSLRARLLLAVGIAAFVALVVADLVTYSSLQSFELNRVDQTLQTILHPVGLNGPAPIPGTGGANDNGSQPSNDGDGGGGLSGTPACTLLTNATVTFAEIRGGSGNVSCSSRAREAGNDNLYSPVLPTHLTVPPVGQLGYFTTGSVSTGGPRFRVQVLKTPTGEVLLLGAPLDTVDATLRRLLFIELAVTLAALVAAVGLGWWLVRVGLRPLVEVEVTADAIADGELDRRVPGEDGRTEVGRLARALNVMLTRIQQAFAERDRTESELRASEDRLRRFVADASHELRTPLAAVSAYAELFSRGASTRPEDLERVMNGIRSESARMASLVEDLVLLARLDEGRGLERQPVELVELAAEARDAAEAVGPRWPVTLDAARPVEVIGDRLRLRQVIDNLLANVRAHTPPGTTTAVRVEREGDEAVLQVTDDGPGLSDEQAALAFERFYRADPSRSRDSGGSGLGLSIVTAIVSSAGGTASAGRGPQGGAEFTIRLPVSPG
ncbi:MAG: sensor histidine kinase [Acidimicrobiales bacterium]